MPSFAGFARFPLFVVVLFSSALPVTAFVPFVAAAAVVRALGAAVDCLAVTALSSPDCAAGGVIVFAMSSPSAGSEGGVVVAVSATARPVTPVAVSAPVGVGARSVGAAGAGARLSGTVAFREATVGSDTTDADDVGAPVIGTVELGTTGADSVDAPGVIAAATGWAVMTPGWMMPG